jgi:pimeloyl-ACP methyl ester carboxylesterase
MTDVSTAAADLFELGSKIAHLYARRLLAAQNAFFSGTQAASKTLSVTPLPGPENAYRDWAAYAPNWAQRGVLFWDTLRQRGNNFLAYERAGKPPVLAFDYEIILDGRKLPRPVNYALVRITAPPGVVVDESRRPFIIVDPRAGHGPGIGGFKQDSQVGVALEAGHPVYFVIFFSRPEPGQTLADVCEAEAAFVRAVAERHPDSPKPAVVGNCQGGWAVMMLAASHPDLTGPVVINGAPMSYWSGSWHGGEGENPMRYLGGLTGGSWSALLASDLGNGLVDGAHLVSNFERLNPANTLWTKYYHLFDRADTEPPRYLQFERWWGGYSLMNEAEMLWIADNLFIGNRLARGEAQAAPHRFIDLKAIRSPVVVFSSAGDNITPPQQALNWIADAYASTEEIKANGQVIVGLLHEDVGHLGIFVSGRVAKKEHAQIVEVLRHIESLRPGLYLMEIHEAGGSNGRAAYEVTLTERRLEDLRKANRFERRDETPFGVVAAVSALGEQAYTLFVRPFLRPFVNEGTAELGRAFHPLRWQRWGLSDLNPFLWPLPAWASVAKATRQPVPSENPYRRAEKAFADMITAGLDLYRDFRDAAMEALFFQIYGPPAVLGVVPQAAPETRAAEPDPRGLPLVQDALAAIGTGGYPEALALVGALVGRKAGGIPLSRLRLVDHLLRNDERLSRLPADAVRRIQARQAVVAELEPEQGLQSLPRLLANPAERQRVLAALDEALKLVDPTPEQRAVVDRIRSVLGEKSPRSRATEFNGTEESQPAGRGT